MRQAASGAARILLHLWAEQCTWADLRFKPFEADGDVLQLAYRLTIDPAVGHAAVYGRFGEGDLAAILAHRASAAPGSQHRAGETAGLQAGTAAWRGFGR